MCKLSNNKTPSYGTLKPTKNAAKVVENAAPIEASPTLLQKLGTITFSLLSYGYFLASFLMLWGFMLPIPALPDFLQVPYSMDDPQRRTTALSAVPIDVLLLLAFVVPHSILARRSIKERMGLPDSVERSFFVLQSSFFLHMEMIFWKDFDGPTLWDTGRDNALEVIVILAFVFGLLFLVSASFAIDHFSLFGLSNGFGLDLNAKLGLAKASEESSGLVHRWHYSLVAHPIMLGMLIGLWVTPIMTLPRLLFATIKSLYIGVAVLCLEEPSLKEEIGQEYEEYLKTVSRFVPGDKHLSKCPFSSRMFNIKSP